MNGAILRDAFNLINGRRQLEYGGPGESFERVALFWGAWLGHPVTAHDVACMMALFKLAREAHGHKQDNLLDAAGYIGLAEDLAPDEDIQNEGPEQ